ADDCWGEEGDAGTGPGVRDAGVVASGAAACCAWPACVDPDCAGACGDEACDGACGDGAGAGCGAALAARLRSSDSRASALNTFEQRPQRTNPCATRRSAADTTSVKAHFGQTVYMCCGGVPKDRASLPAIRMGAYQNTCCKRLSPQAPAT